LKRRRRRSKKEKELDGVDRGKLDVHAEGGVEYFCQKLKKKKRAKKTSEEKGAALDIRSTTEGMMKIDKCSGGRNTKENPDSWELLSSSFGRKRKRIPRGREITGKGGNALYPLPYKRLVRKKSRSKKLRNRTSPSKNLEYLVMTTRRGHEP